MPHRVCPWWIGYFLASPVRRWLGQNPEKILRPYIREGMTVLEPGPGMGFFTIPLAQMVGPSGKVIAVDLQPKMIAVLKRRAAKKNSLDRIDARVTSAETMHLEDLEGRIDFTLAFAVVHEFPDPAKFFAEVARVSKSGAQLLLAEPSGHVNDHDFAAQLNAAAAVGFTVRERPQIPRGKAALLMKI
ncbi:MAG TPA: class I SAM-dependent methyltransferase [Candidatus Sulfotelmatobacter sp.]|nr:class I SAM-dependent methyltransferase [Candidatus Sulfotelmatobacter sp.]